MPSSRYNTPLIVIVGSILLLSFYYFFLRDTGIKNEGSLAAATAAASQIADKDNSKDDKSVYTADSNQSSNESDDDDVSMRLIEERSGGRERNYVRATSGGKPKRNSYDALNQDLEEVESQYEVDDLGKVYNDTYEPIDESDGNRINATNTRDKLERNDTYGSIKGRVNYDNLKGTSKDKFDIDSFLPSKDKKNNWFETIETVDVENSALINIYRPIGTNTIGSSHKNASYDIRGYDNAVCPKFTVSPFLQSSVEPDRSTKSLCE